LREIFCRNILNFSEKIKKFKRKFLNKHQPHLDSDFSLIAFLNWVFSYLDWFLNLSPVNTINPSWDASQRCNHMGKLILPQGQVLVFIP
jgi:hypothetical protein